MKRKPAPPAVAHTADCIEARGGPDQWPTIWDLAQRAGPVAGVADVLAVSFVKAIDACPHPAHEAYRLMFRRPAPAPPIPAPSGPQSAPAAAAEVPA